MKLQGRVAIVTGAARGMGRSHCLALAKNGADIVALDVCHDLPPIKYSMGTERDLNKVVDEVKALGRRVIAVKCDVRKSEEVKEMVEKALDEFGKIDILVNNAGVVSTAPPPSIVNITEEEMDIIVDVNLKGAFLTCKYVVPHMIERRYGKIINITSSSLCGPSPRLPHYVMSKAGLTWLTSSLAVDLAPYNINVNAVSPGLVWTGMTEGLGREYIGALDLRKWFEEFYAPLHLFKREVLQEDVSNAVVFLASEDSRNISGRTIYVDALIAGKI